MRGPGDAGGHPDDGERVRTQEAARAPATEAPAERPGAAEAAAAAARPQPRPKKVKSAPKQPGFILYTKVESGVQHWDQRCVEGLSEDAAARVRAETMAAAKKRDLLKIMSQKVYATVDEANAAALETVVALVERLADEDGTPVATDGALHVAEDRLVPNENTIRNSATKDGDRGGAALPDARLLRGGRPPGGLRAQTSSGRSSRGRRCTSRG